MTNDPNRAPIPPQPGIAHPKILFSNNIVGFLEGVFIAACRLPYRIVAYLYYSINVIFLAAYLDTQGAVGKI